MLRWAALVVLLAVVAGLWSLQPLTLENLIAQGRPAGTLPTVNSQMLQMTWPTEPASHAYRVPITMLAFGTALAGFLLATAMYGLGYLNPEEARRQFSGAYTFLRNKWWFDELYDWLFVRPTLVASQLFARLDKRWIDGFVDGLAAVTAWFSRRLDAIADRGLVDGFVNALAGWTYSVGISLRSLQTGQLRQYVMFIVLGTIAIFLLISMFWNPSLAR